MISSVVEEFNSAIVGLGTDLLKEKWAKSKIEKELKEMFSAHTAQVVTHMQNNELSIDYTEFLKYAHTDLIDKLKRYCFCSNDEECARIKRGILVCIKEFASTHEKSSEESLAA